LFIGTIFKIIYRDLKPENIVLDKDGYIKLIDFGLAKTNVCEKSPTLSFCGTSEYIRIKLLKLAPEVLQGKEYCFSFDWWSYGILIYELIYGHVYFQ